MVILIHLFIILSFLLLETILKNINKVIYYCFFNLFYFTVSKMRQISGALKAHFKVLVNRFFQVFVPPVQFFSLFLTILNTKEPRNCKFFACLHRNENAFGIELSLLMFSTKVDSDCKIFSQTIQHTIFYSLSSKPIVNFILEQDSGPDILSEKFGYYDLLTLRRCF